MGAPKGRRRTGNRSEAPHVTKRLAESLAIAVEYLEAGYDGDSDALQTLRRRIAARNASSEVLAVVAGLFWIVAEEATGEHGDPHQLKALLRKASVEMEVRAITEE